MAPKSSIQTNNACISLSKRLFARVSPPPAHHCGKGWNVSPLETQQMWFLIIDTAHVAIDTSHVADHILFCRALFFPLLFEKGRLPCLFCVGMLEVHAFGVWQGKAFSYYPTSPPSGGGVSDVCVRVAQKFVESANSSNARDCQCVTSSNLNSDAIHPRNRQKNSRNHNGSGPHHQLA